MEFMHYASRSDKTIMSLTVPETLAPFNSNLKLICPKQSPRIFTRSKISEADFEYIELRMTATC